MERKKNKPAGFSIRTSPAFLEILKKLAEHKGLSRAELIEYLVRREYDKEEKNIKTSGD